MKLLVSVVEYEMSQDAGYALWIEPPAFLAVRLNALIEALSAQYGGPGFSAHVTVLGGLKGDEEDLLLAAGALASAMPPFEIRLSGVGREDSFFRCLYLLAEPTSSLMEARLRAEEAFLKFRAQGGSSERSERSERPEKPEKYIPHLSLLYVDIDNSSKDAVIQSIGSAVTANFTVESMSLYRVDGDVPGWRRVGEVFPFTV